MREGELVHINDEYGDNLGVAIFIEKFKPIDRGSVKLKLNSCYVLSSKMAVGYAPTHWHYEVLWEGELKWLHTDCFTLLPV